MPQATQAYRYVCMVWGLVFSLGQNILTSQRPRGLGCGPTTIASPCLSQGSILSRDGRPSWCQSAPASLYCQSEPCCTARVHLTVLPRGVAAKTLFMALDCLHRGRRGARFWKGLCSCKLSGKSRGARFFLKNNIVLGVLPASALSPSTPPWALPQGETVPPRATVPGGLPLTSLTGRRSSVLLGLGRQLRFAGREEPAVVNSYFAAVSVCACHGGPSRRGESAE